MTAWSLANVCRNSPSNNASSRLEGTADAGIPCVSTRTRGSSARARSRNAGQSITTRYQIRLTVGVWEVGTLWPESAPLGESRCEHPGRDQEPEARQPP